MCTVLLPTGDNPIAVNKCIISYSIEFHTVRKGRDSTVDIATRYGLEDSEIESRWGAKFSAPIQTGPKFHSASCAMGTESFPGVKAAGA